MRVELSEGEAVVVTFKSTCREITLAFKTELLAHLTGCCEDIAQALPNGISVYTDTPDTRFNRSGLIYNETFNDEPDVLVGSAEQLMRSNKQMFEKTIRALGAQNEELRAENNKLRHEAEGRKA